MENYLEPRAIIDINAVRQNYKTMKDLVPNRVIVGAVMKADAYGLGAMRIAQELYREGCREFWVAYKKEAEELAQALQEDTKIFYLQGFTGDDLKSIANTNIIPVVNSIEGFKTIAKKWQKFALHVDSGLSRIGLRSEEIDQILPELAEEEIEYVISHLACSDEKSDAHNKKQKNSFDNSLEKIRGKMGVKAGLSASSGALLGDEFCYDMVRIGAFLYGIHSGEKATPKNVLTIRAPILQRYLLPRGVDVGYGATYTTQRETKVAVISFGYADGLRCSLSNRGIIGFKKGDKFFKAPIIGRISMDLTACDVTEIPDELTSPLSEAIVLNEDYTINEMAKDAGTIPYEILTNMNLSTKRLSIEYKL